MNLATRAACSPFSQRLWLLPVCVAILLHLPSLFCPLLYDDVLLIETHPLLKTPGFLAQLWHRDYGLEFARFEMGYYRPLFTLIVYLCHAIWGSTAFCYHAVSLILFASTTALVTRVAALASNRSRTVAIAAGLLYAVHPARLETVNFFMSLPDLLIEVAALALCLHLLRLKDATPDPSRWRTAAFCLPLAALAAITKESAFFIFPALALTALAYAARRASPARRHTTIAALALFAGLGLGMGARAAAGIVAPISLGDSLITLLGAGAARSWQTWWQAWYEILIPQPVIFWRLASAAPSPLSLPAITLSLTLLAGLWLAALQRGRLHIALLIAWAGANAINLLLLGAAGFVYAQRYLAVAPLVILAALPLHLHRAATPRAARLTWLIFGLYLAAHAGFTIAGTATCLSRVGFAAAMHERNPHDLILLGDLAESLNQAGAPAADVEVCIRKATALNPLHTQSPLLHNMLIKRYLTDRDFASALRVADWSLMHYPADPDKMALRAVALASLGRLPEAIAGIDAALNIQPARPEYLQLRREFNANPITDNR